MSMLKEQETVGNRMSFIGIAYAFLVVMLGTTLPTPLYPIYGDIFRLSNLMITVIYAVYAIGVISALLVFGQLSDRIGRRYILIPGVILSAVSSLVFLFADSITPLFIGRVLSGLSAGLFTSTATATLVNLAPRHKQGKASMIASGINMLGLGLGPLLAGILAQYLSYPMRLVFVVDFAILVPAFIAIWFMPEPIKAKQKFQLRIQKLRVPSEVRATFIRAVIPGFAGFSVLGLFTSVSPSFLQEVLHFDNKAVLGVIVFSCFCASAVGQSLLTNTSDRTVLPLGSAILIIGVIFVGLALQSRSLILLLIGAIVSGVGQGFSFRAGLASVNAKTSSTERGEVTSSFFTIAYIALSIPVVGMGLLAKWVGIQAAGILFSIVIALLALMALILLFIRRDE
ncbi:putative MFS family arabinose efflux permease [Scopulibacillus darangshiensis]|uniref:Putative MFS family arabinose efflux permease n=1 Tax=Scopulibacillus darangshiensis TaxID=442528 RepID=A0A4R2NEL5_9BACL|nr:MFS transporter [Scopulibacillus darangshiensis]TCP19703.1 putative MFS family arabinose efflux permease [Scopulibacillus darangshiensis]